ncbi:hypothetical protein H632_c345p2, partial [Helicosporidium sp. ATCC 50920]
MRVASAILETAAEEYGVIERPKDASMDRSNNSDVPAISQSSALAVATSAADDAAEKKRKRLEAWKQEQQRKKDLEEQSKQQTPANGAEDAAPSTSKLPDSATDVDASTSKGWNLEDDSDDENPEGAGAGFNMDVALPLPKPPPRRTSTAAEHEAAEGAFGAFANPRALQRGAMEEGGFDAPAVASRPAAMDAEDEVDPLDAFMASQLTAPTTQQETGGFSAYATMGDGSEAESEPASEQEEEEETQHKDSDEEDDAAWLRKLQSGRLSKGDKLAAVDHSLISYPPFRRDFYHEPEQLSRLSEEQVAELRASLEGLRIRGRAPPRPLQNWHQAGLPSRLLEALRRAGFERPLPIQAQALPAVMSGR